MLGTILKLNMLLHNFYSVKFKLKIIHFGLREYSGKRIII
jgi:hypothetical protein